jgi:osmoprotectant transport system permease protein
VLAGLALACATHGKVSRAGGVERVSVGSKAFPESWILGEALMLLAHGAGVEAEHRANLGGTQIVAEAVRSGAIDAYPEYTGTLREVVARESTDGDVVSLLAREGLGVTPSLGFDDSYALAVAGAAARTRGLGTISDAARHPELRAAFSHEFLGRADGWPGLRDLYSLSFADVRGVDHALALEALAAGRVDVVDAYTTDPQIERLGLRLLADDRSFFPRYDAVIVYRLDLESRAPAALAAMRHLVGRVERPAMVHANAAVAEGATVRDAAAGLLDKALGTDTTRAAGGATGTTSARAWGSAPSPIVDILQPLLRHVELVGASLAGAVLAGIPLGVIAARRKRAATVAMAVAGVVQTVPSLALLALLIPLLGIGALPAVAALFLYGLLPIVQGTTTGLTTISASLAEAAEALGLPPLTKLLRIELPLASPSLLAGVRTSAVISVGTATIAALVGAGGLGDPILRGIELRSPRLILSGAVPAAALALITQGLFWLVERAVVPRGLTMRTHTE